MKPPETRNIQYSNLQINVIAVKSDFIQLLV